MNRRNFLKTAAISIGGVLILPGCAKKLSIYRFFTDDEAECIIAVCEQIIPADENGPGATNAGVINYIDKQLVEVFLWEQPIFREGIKSLQQSALEIYGKNFEKLDFDTQTEFLIKMEDDNME